MPAPPLYRHHRGPAGRRRGCALRALHRFFKYVRAPKVFQTPAVARAAGPRAVKALNPNARVEGDNPTPEELLDPIEAHGREVAEALGALRAVSRPGPAAIPDGKPQG